MNVDLNSAEAASNGADEERELMLLQAAEHVKMARAQRALYQAKAAKNFVEADRIRKHLLEQGIELKDSAAGTTWEAAQ